MFTIIIQEKGGEQRRMVFNKAEVTFGRVQGNDIVLPKGNVSKRHARIVLKDGKFIIVDLKSTNGTYVNGRKITSPLVVKDTDKIYIGDFIVGVDESASEADGPSELTTSPPGSVPAEVAEPPGRQARPTEAMPVPGPGPVIPPAGAAPVRTVPPRPAPISQPLPREIPAPPGARSRPGPSAPPPMIPPPSMGPGPAGMGPPAAPGGPMGAMGPMGPMSPTPMPSGSPMVVAPMPSATFADPGMMAPSMSPGMAPPAPSAFGGPAPMQPPMQSSMPSMQPSMQSSMPSMQPSMPSMQPAPSGPMGVSPAGGMGGQAAVVPLPTDKQKARGSAPSMTTRRVSGRSMSSPRRVAAVEPLDPKLIKMLDLQTSILEKVRAKLELDKVPVERLGDEDLWQRAERAIVDMVESLDGSGELPKYIDQDALIKETLNEALGLGALEDLLADEKIDEIIVDRRDRIVIGKDGVLKGAHKAFSSDDVLQRVIERLVAPTGYPFDEAHPVVDLRLRDGSRLTAAIPPVAPRGPCLLLRKASTRCPTLADLLGAGAMSPTMCDFLTTCVTSRRNLLVCGGPGSGKTTLVGALAQAVARGERIVSIEEVAELAIGRDEWISLETRPADSRGVAVDLCLLLHNALRLRPDRLIFADVHGREAFDLLTTLGANVDGAIVVSAGEGAAAALQRLSQLARLGGQIGEAAARELTANAVEIVVHVTRVGDSAIQVTAIEEILGTTEGGFETATLFHHAAGVFSATGTVPRFYAELEARGMPADAAIFR
jgi:pilus assembly protein CpaF